MQAKTIAICAKCSDCCSTTILDEHGEIIAEHDGYVPSWMPEDDHYGDYIMLDIDIESGKILNWKPPTAEQLQTWIETKD